jgi:integrase
LALTCLAEMKIDGWKSGYSSVDSVLRHLSRKASGYGVPSYASVEYYADVLNQLCKFTGRNPDQLASLPKPEIEAFIHSFLDAMVERQLSKRTVNIRRSFLLMHFKKNGYRGAKELEIETYAVPARYRKLPEHIPSSEEILKIADAAPSTRDRAIILCLYTSGIRESTLRALRYKDVKEDLGGDTVFVPVYPEMKKIVNKACKNNVPYYTFFDGLSVQALKAYLRERETKYGPIEEDEVLFPPDARASRRKIEEAKRHPLAKNELNKMLHKAARNAGINEWQYIHAHCLRKSFEEVLRSRMPDGRILADKVQEFLHGHLLPASQDPYFGSGIRVQGSTISFDKNVAEKLRDEYKLLQFFPSRKLVSYNQLETEVKRQLLIFSDFSEEEIGTLGDLSQYTLENLRSLSDKKKNEKLGLNGNSTQKIVSWTELREHIVNGWELVQKLDESNEAIVRLPR